MNYWLITVMFSDGEFNFLIKTTLVMDQLTMKLTVAENYGAHKKDIINLEACKLGLWEIDIYREIDMPVFDSHATLPALRKSA
jgi:hypothetical protein